MWPSHDLTWTAGDEGTIEKHPKSWNWMPASLLCHRFPASREPRSGRSPGWVFSLFCEKIKWNGMKPWEKGNDSYCKCFFRMFVTCWLKKWLDPKMMIFIQGDFWKFQQFQVVKVYSIVSAMWHSITGWWFQIFFLCPPYLGKSSNLTHIFRMGWNHQLDKHVNCNTLSIMTNCMFCVKRLLNHRIPNWLMSIIIIYTYHRNKSTNV